jgi:hypothetical protein
MLQIVFSNRQAHSLEIAWRNPKPVGHHFRKHICADDGECTKYVQQEFVTDGEVGYWKTISTLEVVVGGRAA